MKKYLEKYLLNTLVLLAFWSASPWLMADGATSVAAGMTAESAVKRVRAITGTLPNGLQTVVWTNVAGDTNKTAELRLVIRAGSLQEGDGQRGFAHFVEHLAFNDTSKYPKETLYRKLEELGLSIGMHSNAFTSFDQTVYKLTLNDFSDEKLETAIDILSQWAMHVQFEQKVVDAEKPVIHEEWRSSEPLEKGWQARRRNAVYKDSRYGERMPIGKMEQVGAATAEQLKAFYTRWYQPNNAALTVTGAVDPQRVADLTKKYFSDWKSTHRFPPHDYNLNIPAIPAEQIFADPQEDGSLVLLSFYQSYPRAVSLDAMYDELVWRAGVDILGQRLDRRVQGTGGAVSGFGIYHDQISPAVMNVSLWASLNGGDLETATTVLAAERNRLLAQGVSAEELDSWRKAYLQRQQLFRPKAGDLSQMAEDFAVYGDALVEQEDWVAVLSARLPQLTPEQVSAASHKMLSADPSVLLVHNPSISVPDGDGLASWLASKPAEVAGASNAAQQIAGWGLAADSKGTVTETSKLGDGLLLWTLGNGMKVYYRHSGEMPGRVFYALSGSGGMDRLSQEGSIEARLAFEALGESGLRDVSGPNLAQWLQDASMHMSPSFDFWDKGITGGGPSDEFPQLMRLLHISLTEGKVDPAAWKHNLENNRQTLEQFASSRIKPWREQIDSVLYANDAALRMMKLDELEVKPERMEQLFRDYFSGAQNYQLAIVGDIREEDVRKAVEASIATLPTSPPLEGTVDAREFPRVTAPVDVEVKGSGERMATVFSKLVVDKAQLPKLDYAQLGYLSRWLGSVLMEELREKDGLVYSPSVYVEGSRLAQQDYALTISLDCDPDKVKTVRERLRQVLGEQAARGPDAARMQAWQLEAQTELKQSLKEPYVLAKALVDAPLTGMSVTEVTDIAFRTRMPEARVLQDALRTMLEPPAIPVWMVWLP